MTVSQWHPERQLVKRPPLATLFVALLTIGCTATSTSSPSAETSDASFQTPRTTTPAESSEPPSATPSAAAEPPRITWSEVPFDGTIITVFGDESRFVAVGEGADGTAAWTSSDGVTWEEHAVPDRAIAEPMPGVTVNARMGGLVRLGDTLFSFGGGSFIDNVFLVVWRWTDGGQWEVIESTSAFYDGGFVGSIGASDDALLALQTPPYGKPSSWRWTADTSWLPTGLASTADEAIWTSNFAWSGGTYVAAGSTATGPADVASYEWPRTPSIWTSSDGLEWTLATVPDDVAGLCAVTALPDGGFVLLGSAGGGPASWTSPDGRSWTEGTVQSPAGIEMPLLESPYTPCQVVQLDGGLVAALGTPGGTMATWMSTDGREWTFGEPLAANGAIASLGDRLVLAGGVLDPNAENGVRQVVLRGSVEP